MILLCHNTDIHSYQHLSIWVFGIGGVLKAVKEHIYKDLLQAECVHLSLLSKNVGMKGNREGKGVAECFQNVIKIPLQEADVDTKLLRIFLWSQTQP